MLRRYYVTLTGTHSGKYIEVHCDSKYSAERIAVKHFGITNVSTAYPEKTFINTMFPRLFQYVGEIFESGNSLCIENKKI